MKISNLPLWVRGLAICLAFAGVSLASPIAVTGSLDETNCGGGGVQVTATMVNWLPPGTVGGTGCIVAGITTNVTWSGGGAILPGDVGNIMNLTFCANCNVPDFMVFKIGR